MNPIDRVVGNSQSVCPSSSGSFSLPVSRLTHLFKAGVLGALALASPAAALQERVRYDGGVIIPQPNFAALETPRQEFGPVYTPMLECLLNRPSPEGNSDFSLAAYARSKETGSKELAPYLEKAGELSPTYATPLKRFPENLSAFFSNGLGAVGNGEKACDLDGDIGNYLECDKVAKEITRLISQEGMDKKIYTGNPDDPQLILSIPASEGTPLRVVVRHNPQEHANYCAAMKHVEENWLQDPCFLDKTDNELLDEIMRLHNLLSGENHTGFRNAPVFVSRTLGYYVEDHLKKLQEMNVSQREIKLYLDSRERVERAEREFSKTSLTKAERAVWEKVVYFPPEAREVSGRMRSFVRKLREYANSDADPVALAAWAHCEFGSIHPYGDYNGREARLIMNAILERGGYRPVIFPNDDEYSAVVNADQAAPGVFAGYLASLIEAQRNGPQVLSYGEKSEPGFLEIYFSYLF